jgi:hypothetical protein
VFELVGQGLLERRDAELASTKAQMRESATESIEVESRLPA